MSSPIFLPDTAATEAFGARLAACAGPGLTIHLNGNLGAGKTTLVRGVLRGLGYRGAVKSPTYTLVEPYEGVSPPVFHFDLYRMADPEELEFLGIRDYLDGRGLCLVEWPERGVGILPPADLELLLEPSDGGRSLSLTGHSAAGRQLLLRLEPPAA